MKADDAPIGAILRAFGRTCEALATGDRRPAYNSVTYLDIDDACTDAVDDATGTTVVAAGGTGDSADAGLGSTRDNPAPLGSAVTGDDWTVTINSVAKVEEDSFGSKAAEGSVLLLVNRTATYDGDDPQGSTPWATVNFVTADGTTVDSLDASTLFVAEDSFDSMTTLYAGGSTAGDRILEVPADGWEQGVLAVSPGMFSDDTFVAVK